MEGGRDLVGDIGVVVAGENPRERRSNLITTKQLEKLKLEYERQLETLREELETERRERQREDFTHSLNQKYQNETELLRQRLDSEGQQHLNTVLQQLNDMVQSNIQNQQDKFKEELNLHIQAVRLTLDQIYQSQLELVAAELENKHQEDVSQLKEKLTNQHQDKISQLEADWSKRLQELEKEHNEELNDSSLQDSLIVQTAEIEVPLGNQEEHLQKLHRRLTEEHKELLKKIAEGLPDIPHTRTPKKKSRNREVQTESEEGDTETESILSMPVTGEEYQHLEERDKILSKAEDIHKTLETQREEIAQLRSRILTEYEQLLMTRADVMSVQTEEVEKLQREMEQLQQKYEDQIKTFQAKIESQAEEAIQSRLNEIHKKEIEDLKMYYEEQLAELHTPKEAEDKAELHTPKEAEDKAELHTPKEAEDKAELHTSKEAEDKAELHTQKEAEDKAELHTPKEAEDKETPSGSIVPDEEVTSHSDQSAENDDLRKEKEYIKSTTMLTVISDEEDEEQECKLSESESKNHIRNKPDDLGELLEEKEKRIEELQERIDIENRANLSLREQLIQADGKLVEMEKMLRTRQCEIENLKGKLTEKDAIIKMLETEKQEIEEKGIRDLEDCELRQNKTIEELNEKLINIQKELEMSQEQEQILEDQLNELQDSQNSQHIYLEREMEALKQDLEHEHKVEVSTLQSESKVQLEIELKRQAADLAFDYNETVKKLKADYEAKITELGTKAASSKSTQEVADTEDDSKSTGTSSTVIEVKNQGKDRKVKVTDEERDDKTDDELDEMETETVKPENKAESGNREESQDGDSESRSESIPEGDTEEKSESTQNESKSSEIEGSESESLSQDGTPGEATQVKQLFGEIARAKEQTFAKLRDEYEGKIKQLSYELEIRDSELKDLTDDYEEKLNNMRVHYEQRIKDLEEDNSEIEVNVIKEKVKEEFVNNFENELAHVHSEYEEKMDLLRQELKEEFDGEKEEMEKQHKEDLKKSEDKYEDLIERIRNGDAPEVAEIVQDKYDTELEMAKTLMQQEFEETLESEQERIEEIHQQTLDQIIKEHQQEAEELKLQHERDMADCRKMLNDEYQAKIQEMEHHYNDEVEKLKLDLQVMLEQKELSENYLIQNVPVTMETSGVTMGASDLFQEEGPELHEETELADLSNSLLGLKGSHAIAIAEIEAEFEKKLKDLKEGLEKEYEDKLVRLRAEMSSTHSSEVEAISLDNEESKKDLDLAHEREIEDLSAKHAKDLHNMEVQYESQMEHMKLRYEEKVENLQRMVSYLQQSTNPQGGTIPKLTGLDAADIEEEDLDHLRPQSSTPRDHMEGEGHIDRVEITERGTPPQKVSPRGEVISEGQDVVESDKTERSVDLINFDTSADGQTGSLKPPSEKPPAVPRDAGIDLTADEDIIVAVKAKSRETTPRNISDQSESTSQQDDDTGSRTSTPTDLLQTKRLADTLQDFQPVSTFESSTEFSTGEPTSLASELREKESKIKELEKEIDEMQAKFSDIIQRRERENEESRNLEMMLRSDLERINSERDNLHRINEQLLHLLSDAVKTYINVEDLINKKLAKVVSTGGAEKSPKSPKEEHRSPPSVPDLPLGAEGGEAPQETSLLSNLTDEGLDLSQRVSESIFQGPELDTDGEEILTDASSRLQQSVGRLLDMIEDTTSQLHDTKQTQRELVTSVSSGHQESVHMTTKIQDLEERLQEEVEAKEYLAMELHKAEGLIEGYSTERETLEQRIQDLEEKKEALVLDLETTKNKLQDLEQVHHEAASLRSEVQRQQQLIQENVGDEAQVSMETADVVPPSVQALMMEVSALNEQNRFLEQQIRNLHDKYNCRIQDLETAGEETERHYMQQLDERKVEVSDLRMQLESSEKQLKANRSFLDQLTEEQAVEREQEREEFQKELEKWKQIVQTKERQTAAENRLKREVDTLNEELQSRIHSHTEIVEQTQKLQRDLSDKQMTEEELKAVIRDLEQEVEEKNVREQELYKKITKLEKALDDEEKEMETEADRESPLPDGEEQDSDTGTTSSETTRACRRRRKLPSHISLHQEEALIKEREHLLQEKDQLLQEKEQLSQEKEEQQILLEEQLKQISALRNQLDDMRHRGDFGDDSQASTLQRQLDRQKEMVEEMERENGELREQVNEAQNKIDDKDRYIIQLTNQIQDLRQQVPQKPDIDMVVQDLSQENEQLKAKLKSVEGELNSTPITVLTQSLIEEKNQEIDHLNSQISHLNKEIEKLKSGEALAKLQEDLQQLQSELDRRDLDNVRASQMSTYSMDTDTEGPPGVSESFAERTNLQQELQDSVAQNWEEISDLKEEKVRLEKVLQEKEEEILHLNEELHAKRELSPKSTEDTGYVHDMLQEKELLIEQMTVQIEGLTAEVDGLTDFQTKLQEDFDTVQTMLEEKEREIETLTRELTEKPPIDPTTLDSVSVLESQVQKLKKDLKEKDNVIEEKEEELYVLNEKAEEKEAELKTLQSQLAEKELELSELQERAPPSEEVHVQLQERTIQLEEKSQELEKMREDFDTVKEHLSIAENLQRKLEQAGMLGPDILMKEKEKEIQGLKAELASLKEKIQSEENDLLNKEEQIQILKDQLTKMQEEAREEENKELSITEKEVSVLKQKIEDADSEGGVKLLTGEIRRLQRGMMPFDVQKELSEKDDEIRMLREELIQTDVDIRALKKEMTEKDDQIEKLKEELNDNNDEIRIMKEEIDEKGNQVQILKEEFDQIRTLQEELDLKDHENRNLKEELDQVMIKKEELDEKDEQIRILKEELNQISILKGIAIEKDDKIRTVKEELDKRNDQLRDLNEDFDEKDDQMKNLCKEIRTLKEDILEKDDKITNLNLEIRTLNEEVSEKDDNIKTLNIEVETLREGVSDEVDQIRRIREEQDEKDNLICTLRDELRDKDSQMMIYQIDVHDKDDQIRKLREELSELDDKEKENEILRAEVQRMVQIQESQEEARMDDLTHTVHANDTREEHILTPEAASLQMAAPYQAESKEGHLEVPMTADTVESALIEGDRTIPERQSAAYASVPRRKEEMEDDHLEGQRKITLTGNNNFGTEFLAEMSQSLIHSEVIKSVDQPELLEIHELENMVRTRDSEIRDLKEELGSLQIKLQQGDPGLIPQLEKKLKEKEGDQRVSQTTITDLKDQINWLQQECETLRQLRLVQDESGQEKIVEKDKEIQTLQNKIIALKSKVDQTEDLQNELEHKSNLINDLEEECEKLRQSAEENQRKLQEQLDRVNAIDGTDDKWEMLQSTQERLEKTTHELTDTTHRLHQVEDRLGEINHQLEDKENDYKQLEADYWEAKAQISDSSNQIQDLELELSKSSNELFDLKQQLIESTSENQDLKRKLDAKAVQRKDSGLTLERSKLELDEIIQEKDQELNNVKERLKEAVELSEQQLHLVEQKDEEFVKLKIEIQQMIIEKDNIIKDLKKQLSDVEADKYMLQHELEEKMNEKVKVIGQLEDTIEKLKVKEEELQRGENAVSMVTMLQEQLEERDKAIREIHASLQNTREELEEKSQELNQVRENMERQTQREGMVSRQVQRDIEDLKEELRMAKEALENANRLGGEAGSRQHIPPLRLQDSTEIDEELELKDPEELQEEILDLRKELDQRKSELQLFHSTASMSAKDYVQKVMDLREELAHQHKQHITDLMERSRSEADTNLAQQRIHYEDEIDSLKLLHKNELEKKVGEVKRDLDKEHKTEINKLLTHHQEEIELMKIREPMLVAHESSALEAGLQLRSEVRQTEQLDGQLLGTLNQLPEGLGIVDANTVGSGDMVYDENLSARLRMLLNRLHNEGVQMLTLSELQFLNRHMSNQCVETEADIASLQAAWMNEKQSLLSAVQSLKDLLAQTHKYRSAEKYIFKKTADVSDWRGELLRSIGYVFAKERETLLAELRSHVLSHPSTNFTEIQKFEQKIRNQEAHQKEALDQIFKADRQSMLAEIRDLRAHANINSLRYQEEKERLTDQLSNMEDSTTKRERQLKRQVQLLEYKLQQEKIIQDDLRTSLESEQHRTRELSSQISREKNNNLDLQSELSSQQLQISKLKDGLEREQSRFVSVTSALEEEKGKCQHLSDLLEKERSMVRTLRVELEDWKLSSEDSNKIKDVMERMQAELNSERDRVTVLEDSQQSDRSTISNLKHELEMEQKSLRTLDLEFKAKVRQMTTALELERTKSADLQSALERERSLNEKLRQNLDSERRALLESTDRENSIVEDMQMELESERSKVMELRSALDREKRRIASNLDNLETDRDKFRQELDQERNLNRQLRNDLDQLELQKLDLTRHYEHERDQCIRLKNEREQLRSEVKGLKDRVSNQVRSRDTEKVSQRQSQRQLERERDDNRMKLHENELEIQRLTQKVLDLEEKATSSREMELEAKRDLEQEKLRNLQAQHVNGDSTSPRSSASDSQERWILYKTQLESICQSLQYLILQCQDQMGKARGIEGLADVISLEKPLKDLLSEIKHIQLPLAFESEGDSNLLLRPNAHAINEKVLHHNSELTNFVSRLTEEKMELRNTLSRLEEEIWRYRQHDGSMQNGDLEKSEHSSENKHLEDRAKWAKERLSLQLALNRAESERDQYKADLRIERERRSTTPLFNGHGSEADKEKIQRLYGKYLRADSYRKALIYQKKYLLLLLGGFQDCEETTLALIARMGVYPSPEDMQRKTKYSKSFTTFRSAVRVIIAISRMKYLVRKWRRATRVGSPVMGGTVDPQQGYTPHARSFSPPRVSSSRGRSPPRFADSPKVTSSRSRPHHSSYSSVSHDPRDVANGSPAYSSPYRGGASNTPYIPISPFTVEMNGASNYSVHMTPPTRDYSSHKPSTENSGARRKILSSASTTPKATTPTSSHRTPKMVEEQSSLHDDYIARLENLQIRLGSMECDEEDQMGSESSA